MLKFKGFKSGLKGKNTDSRTLVNGGMKAMVCAFTLGGLLASSAYAGGKADDYMSVDLTECPLMSISLSVKVAIGLRYVRLTAMRLVIQVALYCVIIIAR